MKRRVLCGVWLMCAVLLAACAGTKNDVSSISSVSVVDKKEVIEDSVSLTSTEVNEEAVNGEEVIEDALKEPETSAEIDILIPAVISPGIDGYVESLGAIFEPTKLMAGYEKVVFEYLNGDVEKKGGPYVMPMAFHNAGNEYFSFYDINGDGMEELLLGNAEETPTADGRPSILFAELLVAGDSFEESDLGGGICRINPSIGAVRLNSDGVEVEYLKLSDNELKPYIKYTVEEGSDLGPEGTYIKTSEDASVSTVSGEEALGELDGFYKLDDLNLDWQILSQDTFIIATRMTNIPTEYVKEVSSVNMAWDENDLFTADMNPGIMKYTFEDYDILVYIVYDPAGLMEYIYSLNRNEDSYNLIWKDMTFPDDPLTFYLEDGNLSFSVGYRTDKFADRTTGYIDRTGAFHKY